MLGTLKKKQSPIKKKLARLWDLWFNRRMKIKARINKDGLMGSASREHKVKKGKGSFKRREKHQKNACH